ncbi:MAG: 50S ribosomal protein L32 [Candidatus Omnitrophica bacterium]|nr:50S ribosomal protein L32 [Candidatus Omnitrophota bacterium]
MAHPKRQHSVQRTRKRRTHWKVEVPGLNPCSNCAKPIVSHRVCPFCGFYKGKPVINVQPKEKKKK